MISDQNLASEILNSTKIAIMEVQPKKKYSHNRARKVTTEPKEGEVIKSFNE